MRIPRVYSSIAIGQSSHLELGANVAHYLGKVLRMAVGRPVILFDGTGGEYQAEITGLSKSSIQFTLGEFSPESRESPLALELAIGLSRGERFEWVLQKATELGVSRIVPLLTERVEVKLSGERLAKKREHWQQIVVSACEQCQRTLLPQLSEPQPLATWLAETDTAWAFVLHHRAPERLQDYTTSPTRVALLVGPEGGLSEGEIEQALNAGLKPLALGPRVLRTETAPIAALSVLQYQWGDLSR
ncbi:16S rRNA (uracil(1498)-N(3))-methyltransferase [Halioxenophilus sp. WMMB6]|uniref:16S rRNA (uracil(1498)-N(3))-methyltransferase n=1 Tax=Halioxenophilus sp. WMMB6 TaxID=3073815 RepID=UPI00295E3CDD|nr:16S rRNA (uracil(1498)-N(3))-methyltransferase [Halioxenophilus sp. WMMB6]